MSFFSSLLKKFKISKKVHSSTSAPSFWKCSSSEDKILKSAASRPLRRQNRLLKIRMLTVRNQKLSAAKKTQKITVPSTGAVWNCKLSSETVNSTHKIQKFRMRRTFRRQNQ